MATSQSLTANGYSRESKDDTAPHRRSEDPRGLEDAEKQLVDDLGLNRCGLRARYDVVVVNASVGINIRLDDNHRIPGGYDRLRAGRRVQIMRGSHSTQWLIVRHYRLWRSDHSQKEHNPADKCHRTGESCRNLHQHGADGV